VYDGDFSEEVERTLPTVTPDQDSEPYVETVNVNWNNADLSTLDASGQVELTITTPAGSQRYVSLRVPDSLVGEGGGTVQL
jgi:flagellin FlaB